MTMLITVSQLSPGFVNIQTSKNKRGRTIDWNLWVEFSTASWLADRLDEVHGTPYHAGGEFRMGGDLLKIRTGGPEQAPVLNVHNDRPEDAECGGYSGVGLPFSRLAEVAQQIRTIIR